MSFILSVFLPPFFPQGLMYLHPLGSLNKISETEFEIETPCLMSPSMSAGTRAFGSPTSFCTSPLPPTECHKMSPTADVPRLLGCTDQVKNSFKNSAKAFQLFALPRRIFLSQNTALPSFH